jgi:hypothetical protein
VRGVGNECGFSRRHTAAAAGSSSRAAKAAIDHALEPKKMQLDPPWNPDPSFKVADAILADPEFASALKTVLKIGHVLLRRPRRRRNE